MTTATLPTRPAPPAFVPSPSGAEAPALSRREKAIQTTRARAATLTAQGYRFEPLPEAPMQFFCRRPVPLVDKRTGEIVEGYHCDATTGSCSCLAFANYGTCKHSHALALALREAAALLGPWLTVPVEVGR